ncbi:MAG: 50S ribosomal protein L17 [Myxococcales bacterium]|nr:50S ribosomal protein L17 [Myxococcales bacterium]
MRHSKLGRKFGRNTSHRRAMFRNLAGNLVLHERIETTEAKAKELRRIMERLITKATRLGEDLTVDVAKLKDADRERVLSRRVHAYRTVSSFLPKKLIKTINPEEGEEVDTVHKLFTDIAPRYMDRVKAGKGGGYTRIIKLGNRRGDNAPTVLLELVGAPVGGKAAKEKPAKAEAASEKKPAKKAASKSKKAAASDEE